MARVTHRDPIPLPPFAEEERRRMWFKKLYGAECCSVCSGVGSTIWGTVVNTYNHETTIQRTPCKFCNSTGVLGVKN